MRKVNFYSLFFRTRIFIAFTFANLTPFHYLISQNYIKKFNLKVGENDDENEHISQFFIKLTLGLSLLFNFYGDGLSLQRLFLSNFIKKFIRLVFKLNPLKEIRGMERIQTLQLLQYLDVDNVASLNKLIIPIILGFFRVIATLIIQNIIIQSLFFLIYFSIRKIFQLMLYLLS